MSKPKILVVDDEQYIVELIRFNLEKEGYTVITAGDGKIALEQTFREKPDLIVLDIMLPGVDGLEVCRTLQRDKETQLIPIIMLTAKGEEIDKVLGLELGADDYMTKPFSPRELVARIKARLRRNFKAQQSDNQEKENILAIGGLKIDIEKFSVYLNGQKVDFTPKEFELLKLLASNPGKVFTREYLLEKIWGYDFAGDTRTVDVHIRHIRKKIEPEQGEKFVETVRGVGYKFREMA
ncbi:two component transcriptional regulator, winged helix family [Thermincola ferriacetica]|uniref:Stage 0 sporulation protein A homolog n=2 Tax=Thermincola TaxID=278993 RepID=D5X970_THEPJ|nr:MULTISPECIES: response regulator transcription factor [Thermincola]ADG82974.1 two component transcriptional regulator, winged helix family [Thermincola potens JR]KNZ68227.1 two component transcriptional regulator, winged helix family [Thermincola ferriacetica]